MREKKLALTYAHLSSRLSQPNVKWRSEHEGMHDLTAAAFDAHVAALCEAAAHRELHHRNGEKSASVLMAKVERRSARTLERNALDLQRLADLQDRMGARDAQAERRRWFVLGRLLARAAADEKEWGRVLDLLVARGGLSASETKLVAPVKAPRPSGRGAQTYHQDE
jgi:hypothetical protein